MYALHAYYVLYLPRLCNRNYCWRVKYRIMNSCHDAAGSFTYAPIIFGVLELLLIKLLLDNLYDGSTLNNCMPDPLIEVTKIILLLVFSSNRVFWCEWHNFDLLSQQNWHETTLFR